jgi:hypothetical protein
VMSKCIHCSREIVKRKASQEYIDTFGDDGLVWFDKTDGRALCMSDAHGTAHVTQREWNSGL